jgi:acetyltransferase-like isoleucine patch superfamily enzyme
MSPLRAFIVVSCFKALPTIRLRAWYLRKLGAKIGTNVRIHSIDFMNTEVGFDHLIIGSNCYLGPGVLIDLAGEMRVMDGAVISARTILLSHDDPGASHNSPLSKYFPPSKQSTVIGKNCWLGAGSIVLAGTEIGEQCVLAAGSVAKGILRPFSLYAGHPARHKRQIPSSIP